MSESEKMIPEAVLSAIIVTIHTKLNEKTNWGRTQIKKLIHDAVLKHYFKDNPTMFQQLTDEK